jgi:hypothetical protein
MCVSLAQHACHTYYGQLCALSKDVVVSPVSSNLHLSSDVGHLFVWNPYIFSGEVFAQVKCGSEQNSI